MRSLSPPSLYQHRNSYEERHLHQQELQSAYGILPLSNNNDPMENGSNNNNNNTSSSIFPPTPEMQHAANKALEINNKSFKVVYAGIMSYKTTTAMISVNKRLYFVLTNNHLLQYKSEQKARSEIDLFDAQRNGTTTAAHISQDKVVVHLRDILGIHSVISPPSTFRIEYLQPDTKQPQALVLTTDNNKECQQWISAFRHAVKVHHVSMMAQGTVTSTEKFAAVERLSKQKDMVDKRRNPLLIHKVIYKEKRIKVADGKNSTKEVFQVVSLVVGKFSLYLLPPSGVADEKYLKSVERDRYGLLAIHSIQFSGEDDTFKLLLGQVGHATRQLVLVSTFCEYIIQHLRQAIHAVALTCQPITYSALLPTQLRHAYITPLQTLVDDDSNLTDYSMDTMDQDAVQFNIVLHAYCAALNLNKARFHYKLGELTGGARSFILLPPHEVNESSASYTSFELLAICRALYLNPCYSELILRHQSLKALEEWTVDKSDTWTTPPIPAASNASNVLSNELYAILSSNSGLQRLDLTDCQIGISNKITTTSALNILGLAMQNGTCGLGSIAIGKNSMKKPDLQSLLTGIRSCPTSLVELDVHECGLDDEQVTMLLTTLLSERPKMLQLLDISTTAKNPHPHHSHYHHQRQGLAETTARLDVATIRSLLQQCKRLSILRLRGYDLSLERHMFDISRLRELDLGYNRLGTDGVDILCQWMQTSSFHSVEALHVNGCGLDGQHLQSLLLHISISGNRQVHLNAGSNLVWREVMYIPKLCNALMQNEGPCSLSLAKTDWEDGTLREFLDCIRDNHTIVYLDLSDIRVTGCDALSDDTVRVLASVFERNTAIRVLKLNISVARSKEDGALVGKGIVDALDAGLKHNRVLERLELNGIGMGDVGATVLANSITINRVLKSIHLDENKITIDGYRALVTALETTTSIVDLPKPRVDIRHQLSTLKETINELTQIENETKWFIMHSTGSDVKQAKTQLLMQTQARQAAELNYKQILDVVDDMLRLVARNGQRFNTNQDREIQAQELAIAQLRLQANRSISANLSAVGIQRMRTTNSATSSYSSHSDHATAIPNKSTSSIPLQQQQPLSPLSSSYNNEMTSPTLYYSPYGSPINPPLPPTPQLYDGLMSVSGNLSVGGQSNYSGGSNGSLSRRNTATTSIGTIPKTPYGTPGPYSTMSTSSAGQGNRQYSSQRLYYEDDGSVYMLDNSDYAEGYDRTMARSIYSSSSSSRYQQQKVAEQAFMASHQQQRQKIYRLPEIPDVHSSYDSLLDEERLCNQFNQRVFLPPDERD
ncbi:hypothetical protein BC941DRAFT_454278 [Chlamydoabsidia padenii]|nr:hypothetical protein BC941DRAFT_454278 [Chlamydoabsidia padenii]